jgi:ketosteroid isomerase-like protein
MRSLLILFFMFCAIVFFPQKELLTIRELMSEQEKSWNTHDIEGFMKYYWKSDSLKFIGKKGITYGWQKTLDNYRNSYPNGQAMGTLVFEVLNAEKLSGSAVYVIGKWNLLRKEDSVGGYFTLLWKKMKGRWVIVSDHTS